MKNKKAKSKGEKQSKAKTEDTVKENNNLKGVEPGQISLNSGKNWTTVTKRGEVPANKV